MSIEQKTIGLSPRHQEWIEEIKKKIGAGSNAEVVRKAVESLAEDEGVKE